MFNEDIRSKKSLKHKKYTILTMAKNRLGGNLS
jgi:hypothetical protein